MKCNRVDQFCEAVPELPEVRDGVHARFTCSTCGLPVCDNCSLLLMFSVPKSQPARRRRTCHGCAEQLGFEKEVNEHLSVLAGHDKDYIARWIVQGSL